MLILCVPCNIYLLKIFLWIFWIFICKWISKLFSYSYMSSNILNISDWYQFVPRQIMMRWTSHKTKFMGPTWVPPGSCRPQMGPMLAPWTLLSGMDHVELYDPHECLSLCDVITCVITCIFSKKDYKNTRFPPRAPTTITDGVTEEMSHWFAMKSPTRSNPGKFTSFREVAVDPE